MTQTIDDILPYYIGNEITFAPDFMKRYIMGGVLKKSELTRIHCIGKREGVWESAMNIRLILRPLNDITDKELSKLWDELGWYVEYVKKKEYIMNIFNNLEKDNDCNFKEINFISQSLRRKGFDMDELIRNNWAIEIKRLRKYEINDFL